MVKSLAHRRRVEREPRRLDEGHHSDILLSYGSAASRVSTCMIEVVRTDEDGVLRRLVGGEVGEQPAVGPAVEIAVDDEDRTG
jgi:hypothetical protein